MQAVLAQRSPHGHAAQVQQGPGDTWRPGGRREGVNASPEREEPAQGPLQRPTFKERGPAGRAVLTERSCLRSCPLHAAETWLF